MKVRLEADAQFEAEDAADAAQQLSAHFALIAAMFEGTAPADSHGLEFIGKIKFAPVDENEAPKP